VARGRSSTCSLTTAVRLSAIAFEQRLLAHMGKPVGVLVRTADELAAVRDGNPFPAAPGKFTVAIFLDEQPPARQHLGTTRTSGHVRFRAAVRGIADINRARSESPHDL